MSHTYSQNVVHVVFSTKDRRKSISPEFQPRLWAYVAGICQKLDILVHAAGGTEDHIHLLIQVPPSVALAKATLTVKSNSSRWANEQGKKFVRSRICTRRGAACAPPPAPAFIARCMKRITKRWISMPNFSPC